MSTDWQSVLISHIPDLFKYKSVLYVGASRKRSVMLPEFTQAKYEVSILEAFIDNVEHFQNNQSLHEVIHGDIRTFVPKRKYDVIFWWHGPEHIEEYLLYQTLERLGKYCNHVLIAGCPWGIYKQHAEYGNAYEEHRVYYDLHKLRLLDININHGYRLSEIKDNTSSKDHLGNLIIIKRYDNINISKDKCTPYIICIPLYRRPEYTKGLIDSLQDCIGINKYTVIFHIEPSDKLEKQTGIIEKSALSYRIVVNNKKLGLGCNVLNTLDHAFQLSDYVIYTEEDVLLGKDALQFFEFVNTPHYESDPTVFCASAFNRTYLNNPPEKSVIKAVTRKSNFNIWGIGLWKSRWNFLKTFCWNGWDTVIGCQLIFNRSVIRPVISRSQNIGQYSSHAENLNTSHHKTNLWINNIKDNPIFNQLIKNKEFHEIS